MVDKANRVRFAKLVYVLLLLLCVVMLKLDSNVVGNSMGFATV